MTGKAVAALIFLLTSPHLLANDTECTTSIRGQIIQLTYDNDEPTIYENYSFREIFFRGWGEITCPAFVTIRHLTPDLTDTERSAFCLNFDKEKKTFIGYSLGERNAYLECTEPKKSVCERVNASKEAAIALSSAAAGLTGGASAAAGAAGVSAVAHSSGAVILTGSSGYIAGTLATMGASALALLTSPITVAAAAVSVVAVGGAVYVCKEDQQNTLPYEGSSVSQ